MAGRSLRQAQCRTACNSMGDCGKQLKGQKQVEAGPLVSWCPGQHLGTAQANKTLCHQATMSESVISSACMCVQARETNARLCKELHLEQQRRQIAVGALIGSS